MKAGVSLPMFCCVNAVPVQTAIVLITLLLAIYERRPLATYGRRPLATYGRRDGDQHERAGEPLLVPLRERKDCWHDRADDPLPHHAGAERRLHH